MKLIETPLEGVVIVQPPVFGDDRGFFMETYHALKFRDAGLPEIFLQDNHSRSARGVLRGLHYQEPNPQGKLVRVTRGAVFDVAVDIRRSSPRFGSWFGVELNEENRMMLWVPPGFAHGFCVTSDIADVVYKCTVLYEPQHDRNIAWNDPSIAVDWPVKEPSLSARDAAAPLLADAAVLPG